MDSFNNALYSASHAIWGETHPEHIKQQQQEQHGDEPLSGVQGKGIADDPYDGGNRDIQPGIPAEPEVISTPIGHDAPELSTAVNSENYESQLGGDEAAAAAATGATTGPTGWDASRIPTGPEDPPFGTDPVSADATALSSTFNLSGGGGGGGGGGVMGVPTGLSRDLGPSIGAVNQTSVNPASIGAGTAGLDEYGDFENAPSDKCVRGLDLGGGGSSSGEASDRVEDNPVEENPVEEPTAGGVDGVGGEGEGKGEGKGEGEGGGDDEVYAQVPHIKSNGPSKEALRGPSAPPAREEYEFERNMSQIKPAHTKPKAHKAGKSAKPATEDHHQKANVMSKMKERFGLHHTNKT